MKIQSFDIYVLSRRPSSDRQHNTGGSMPAVEQKCQITTKNGIARIITTLKFQNYF